MLLRRVQRKFNTTFESIVSPAEFVWGTQRYNERICKIDAGLFSALTFQSSPLVRILNGWNSDYLAWNTSTCAESMATWSRDFENFRSQIHLEFLKVTHELNLNSAILKLSNSNSIQIYVEYWNHWCQGNCIIQPPPSSDFVDLPQSNGGGGAQGQNSGRIYDFYIAKNDIL